MERRKALTKLLSYMAEQMSAVRNYLPSAVQDQQGEPENWSAKDNLFHALEWANYRLEMLETFTRGEAWEEEDYGDYTDVNREIFETYRDSSWGDLEEMIDTTYQRGISFLEDVSKEILESSELDDDRPNWRVLADYMINHPMIHIWDLLVKNDLIGKLEAMFGKSYANMLLQVDSSQNWQGGVHYNQACLLALSDQPDQSLNRLEDALQANPQLIEWAKQDTDLETLKGLPEYQGLFSRLAE